ncbi:MAG TPA: RluA family pseudouridine synthase [Polyangia bacterium]|nr:RluA family pseudouridine synthase [Polyangia bacterium]
MPRFLVGASSAGLRLDHFLAQVMGGVSVHAARRLLTGGSVRVDGKAAHRKGERVVVGQTVEVETAAAAIPADGEGWVLPDPSVILPVLYQDGDLVAVNKPAGVAAHPLRPDERGTAANGLVALFPECATASDDPREAGLGHRLDRDTSGVLLAARRRPVWPRLRAALGDAGCEKTYVAQVFGLPPEQGHFDGAIGRVGRHGARVSIDAGRNPLPAHTEWQRLDEVEADVDVDGSTALVRARLHAGRAHQVRAHLAAAGFPIVGDPIYGNETSRAFSAGHGITGLRLHAESIRLRHPITDQTLVVSAPPPTWFFSAGGRAQSG